jgi:hypothetical protein
VRPALEAGADAVHDSGQSQRGGPRGRAPVKAEEPHPGHLKGPQGETGEKGPAAKPKPLKRTKTAEDILTRARRSRDKLDEIPGNR